MYVDASEFGEDFKSLGFYGLPDRHRAVEAMLALFESHRPVGSSFGWSPPGPDYADRRAAVEAAAEAAAAEAGPWSGPWELAFTARRPLPLSALGDDPAAPHTWTSVGSVRPRRGLVVELSASHYGPGPGHGGGYALVFSTPRRDVDVDEVAGSILGDPALLDPDALPDPDDF